VAPVHAEVERDREYGLVVHVQPDGGTAGRAGLQSRAATSSESMCVLARRADGYIHSRLASRAVDPCSSRRTVRKVLTEGVVVGFFTGNNVVLTGGAGFIGNHLLDRLLRDGAPGIIADNLSSGSVDRVLGGRRRDRVEIAEGRPSLTQARTRSTPNHPRPLLNHVSGTLLAP
jgi:NAD dependent epimerase/dehydratase family